MADAKLVNMTEETAPASADWLYLVKAGGGDRKVQMGNLLVGIDDNAPTTALTIDTSRRLLHLTGVSVAVGGGEKHIQLADGTGAGALSATRWGANTAPALIATGKSRGSLGVPGTAIVTGDNLFRLDVAADDGTDVATVAVRIIAQSEGTIAGNQIPANYQIQTANSSGTLTEALRLDSAQALDVANGELKISGSTVITAARHLQLRSYTVATVPAPTAGQMIHVSDETGGAQAAYADGTNWRRISDGAIVS